MAKLISECISNETFKDFGYKIVIRNETSHTQITKPELISIEELKDNGLILEMPNNSCQKGHSLSIFFLNPESVTTKIKLPEAGAYRDAMMEAIAKVESIEMNDSKQNSVFVEINFTQIDLQHWKQIIKQHAAKQNKIDEMLMSQHGRREKE
jgi:hypothetical protein